MLVPRKPLAVAAALAVLLLSTSAAADPPLETEAPTPTAELPEPLPSKHLRMRNPGTLIAANGKSYGVPIGSHILVEESWNLIDAELIRLQEVETRLTAENKKLRESVSGWQPGWKTVATVLAVGLAGGWYLQDRF